MSKILKRHEVDEATTWDVTSLFKDETLFEAELVSVVKDVETVLQYKGKLHEDAEHLFGAIKTLETLQERLVRLSTYAMLQISADGTNPTHQANAAKVSANFAEIAGKLAFFEPEILSIDETTIHQYMEEEQQLQPYKKMLQDILAKKPYTLLPEVEEVLASLSDVLDAPYMIYERSKSSDMTFKSFVDVLGNTRPMSEALYEDEYEMATRSNVRKLAYDRFVETFNRYKNTYAATYATEVQKQVTLSKVRGYDSVIDMLLHEQQVTKEMYENQLHVIQEELAPHMRRLAKLKEKIYQLDNIRFCDLKAPIDPDFEPTISFEEAEKNIIASLEPLGIEYSAIMKKAFSDRWIDYASNVGKQSGAFCASPYGAHPYILLTWTGNARGMFTLAHELGHAGHFYLANEHQTLFNTEPSTYFVEAPSTMNELLLAEHLMKETDDPRMKRWIISVLLDTYYHNFVTHLLEGAFQQRVYTLAEEGVPLTADVLCEEKEAVIRNFWGDTVELDKGAGLTWMRQPHYYMGLYPYTYSAGLTVATAQLQKIKREEDNAIHRWLEVLRAGGTKKPVDLINMLEIDMTTTAPIKEAVAYVGKLIDELEKSFAP
ncbi:oligoendopeptidase F [Pseudogracilibacillus sp. ICA-222130]|uniref:oligoendopeptidase F n=1 Tax=Pseudogracilibacillus sp. ICA-222130 TaxID=3134655 RepID=UPI0030BB8EE1